MIFEAIYMVYTYIYIYLYLYIYIIYMEQSCNLRQKENSLMLIFI